MCQYWPNAGSSNSPSVQIIISFSSMAIHLERKTVTSQNPGLIGSLWDDPDLNNMAQINKIKISFFCTWHPSSQWSPIYPPCMSWHTRVLYCKGERLFVGSGSTKPLLIFMMSWGTYFRCKCEVTKQSLSKQGKVYCPHFRLFLVSLCKGVLSKVGHDCFPDGLPGRW